MEGEGATSEPTPKKKRKMEDEGATSEITSKKKDKMEGEGAISGKRLDDVFQDEVMGSFPSITGFLMFARSRRGLQMEEFDIQAILDHDFSVKEQKMQILWKWQELSGIQATVQKIRSLVENFKDSSQTALVTDVFQDEVIRSYPTISAFLKFARSKKGLQMEEPDIQINQEDYASPVEEQKMQILRRWQELNGPHATVPKIRSLVENFYDYSQQTGEGATSEHERLVDVFYDEVLERFGDFAHFLKFARSRRGLRLEEHDIEEIRDAYCFSVDEQQWQIVRRWEERNCFRAVSKIRSLVENFYGYSQAAQETEHERLVDVFYDEVLERLKVFAHFLKFARSKRGLRLEEHDIKEIRDAHRFSVDEQQWQIVRKWEDINGFQATVSKFRSLVENFKDSSQTALVTEHERLIDVFQDEVIQSFPTMAAFLKFAQSEKGLQMEEPDFHAIGEDNAFSVEEQKMQILFKWQDCNGSQATVSKIRSLVAEYIYDNSQVARETEHERFEDVFQDEVIRSFAFMTTFFKFARSKRGLQMREVTIQTIPEANAFSVDEQKMQILFKWKELNGRQATVPKIRILVKNFYDSSQAREEEYEWLKDNFRHEVIRSFPTMTAFLKFARSKKGLKLEEHDIEEIREAHRFSVDGQIVRRWEDINGRRATIPKLRSLVKGYLYDYRQETVYTKLSEEYWFVSYRELSQNSAVYLGWQKTVGGATRDVVVKLIKDSESNRENANHLLKLHFHPNVTSMLHFSVYTSDIGSYIYLAMEKCRPQNLKEYMKKLRKSQIRLNDDQKLAMAKQFLLGLKFIHINGIINGNIKLENVLISQDGNYLKISSFGFRKPLHHDSPGADQSREFEDTDGIGAPETYSNNVFSKEADVFSAGLLVHSFVSNGRHAYGDDPHSRISNIRANTNRDLSTISITERKEMEKLLNHTLEFEPKNRITVEVALENNIFRNATTDLSLPNNVFELTRSQHFRKEKHLDDEFRDNIIPAFAKIVAFRRFARSIRGLCLDEEDLQLIANEHANSFKKQKMCILRKWQEKMGPAATMQKIRSILEEYQKSKPELQLFKKAERLEDEFQDHINQAFARIEDFRSFAKSERGLRLDQKIIRLIAKDHADSVETQKMCILAEWRKQMGMEATVQKIRSILAEYQKHEPERLRDVFQGEIVKVFPNMDDFLEFARSSDGLLVDESDIENISADYHSERERRMQILFKWQERNGSQATVQKIRSSVESFQAAQKTDQASCEGKSQDQESAQLRQLKCVFEEVTKQYKAMKELKGFAKSKSGLGLTDSEFQDITSFAGQKMQMLMLWMKRLGSEATVQNLQASAERYAAERDFIRLPNGSFGMYKKRTLRDQCQVYLGAQEESDSDEQQFAVKLLHYRKDRAEAEMLKELDHENVVKVLDVGEYSGGLSLTTYVVMELCSTQHLGDIIKTREFEDITALSWARQIVGALVFIHKNNIVHLDIKPQNILFTQDQKYVKLADFDSSKKIQEEDGLIQNPSEVGSEGYRAPEMYIERQITLKVDIFAAGVTLAEVFSHGIHPFGTDRYLYASRVMRNDHDLSNLRIVDKDSATKLLTAMLYPKPESRPTSSGILADALFQK